MVSVAYKCPQCGKRLHKPGKCSDCNAELTKVCAFCEHPQEECTCN